MEIHFPSGIEGKLNRIAAERGTNSEALVFEAVERMLGYDEWFIRQVQQGIEAAERGEFVEHDEVLAMVDKRYPDKRYPDPRS